MITMYAYYGEKMFCGEPESKWSKQLVEAEIEAGNDCAKALDGLGFYLSSEYYPENNIEGMGLEVYSSHGSSDMSKEFSFLVAMSACDTSMQYILISDIPSLYNFLAKYLPVIKLANETMIDRETHYEQG